MFTNIERCQHELENQALLVTIRQIHANSHGSYGYRRVFRALLALGYQVGRERVARLMQQHNKGVRCLLSTSTKDF